MVSGVILSTVKASANDDNIAKVLSFFGVPSRTLTVEEFSVCELTKTSELRKLVILCSSDAFVNLTSQLDRQRNGIQWWSGCVNSVFIYGERDPRQFGKRGGVDASVGFTPLIERSVNAWMVCNDCPIVCGAMSGIRVEQSETHDDFLDGLSRETTGSSKESTGANNVAFARTMYHGVPVFVTTVSNIIDLAETIAVTNFDIRKHFLSAAPIVMFVKWAFNDICWKPAEVKACLVIDDPPLKPRYGHLSFKILLDLMRKHEFASSIAFIPWNWRRSSTRVARLFVGDPRKYSLSIHGCDHTGGEFGTTDKGVLAWRARLALERMSRHEKITGIEYDRVMVFPQGVFSQAALSVLKHTQFIAAVNTEISSVDQERPIIRVSDAWQVALMNYDSFPMFTRRYPSQGIENFAFDILLGKPCLIVIHHDWCRGGCTHLTDFIDRLNSLNCPLSWTTLGEVVRSSSRQREVSLDHVEMEIYGNEAHVANTAKRRRKFVISKQETNPSSVSTISVGLEQVPWSVENDWIKFVVELDAGEATKVCIRFSDYSGKVRPLNSMPYKIRTMFRRYLSEARDNYVSRWTGCQ